MNLLSLNSIAGSLRTHLAIISVAIISILIFYLPSKGFWCVDNSDKYIVAKSIIENRFKSAEIRWKGEEIWDNKELKPLAPPFSIVHNNKILSMFPPLFSFIAALVIKQTGYWGIHIFGIIGTLLTLYNLHKIAEKLGLPPHFSLLALWVSFIGTPLLFYTFTFWEHSLVTGFCLWSILRGIIYIQSPTNRNLLFFALPSASAIYLRDVAIIFTISLSILLIWTTNRKSFLKKMSHLGVLLLLILTPLLIFNYLIIGDPFGPHMIFHIKTSSSILSHMADRIHVFYYLFASSFGNITAALSYLFLNIGAIFYINFIKNSPLRLILIRIYLTILTILSIFILLEFIFDLASPFYSNSLMGVTPFLFAGFIKTQNPSKEEVFLRRIIIAYPLLYALAAPLLGSTGFHWGCRFLLTLYPILSLLSCGLLHEAQDLNLKKIFISAFIASVLLQSYSLGLLKTQKTMLTQLNSFVKSRPEEVIILMHTAFGHDLAHSFMEKAFFNVTNKKELKYLNQLLKKIKDRGVEKLLIISRPEVFRKNRPLLEVDERKNGIDYRYRVLNFTITEDYRLKQP